ncbi:hypothetical protein RhiirC2_802132 [Rhizophagus irregularis]|uniref:Uncharacterized protein n=1 Tax=Rhizophagus irregularis TaxID=588596 RepID=A0A2N1M1M1_9GLOM|nr:hypothetical protein RhiirC2_802132 [Rhizophagus irregularis]
MPSPNTGKDKKADKQDKLTQALFDYVAEDTHAPVASTSDTFETSKTSKPPEPVIDEPKTSNEAVNMLPKETPTDSSKPIKKYQLPFSYPGLSTKSASEKGQSHSVRIQMSS